ncbi:MAG: SDR family oxidoreductase [Proteobacteria bacterium]|nr:SDR family oxidoreductase [Pseudomonadota bacterium]
MSAVAARFSLKGRKALITGGSMSIGRAIALGFAEAGADIAVHYSSGADAERKLDGAAAETLDAIARHGVKGHTIDADLALIGAGHRVVEGAIAALGRIDILVIGASIQYRGPFESTSSQQIAEQFAINFRATVELLQAALPPMRERGWGRVLTIGSVNQVRPEPKLAVYAALKSAQQNLCLNLSRQYVAHGVLLNNLAPGLVATERNRWRRQDTVDWARIQARASPSQRAGTPEEMVGAALLLCSDAGSYIAGADLMITGAGHLPR